MIFLDAVLIGNIYYSKFVTVLGPILRWKQCPLPQNPIRVEAPLDRLHRLDFRGQVLYFQQVRLPLAEPVLSPYRPSQRDRIPRQFRGHRLGRRKMLRAVGKRIYMEVCVPDMAENDEIIPDRLVQPFV